MSMILSPVGNKQALYSAVNNGAQAVYLGLSAFNARLKADNFTTDELVDVVNYCHLFGVKVYITVNTNIKQRELTDAFLLANCVYNSNADGIIVTDLALLQYCGKTFGDKIDIVASTQLNVHDKYGALYVQNLGATTVVVARETPISDIKDIIDNTSLKVECFVHGAMCVCQSGQCLMSAIVGGNSGNRGQCMQPCRQLYTAYNEDSRLSSGYLLSPKDLCMYDDLDMLTNLGVSVYKIEGRNRRSQYSGLTTNIYTNALAGNMQACHLDNLRSMYNRGNYMTTEYLDSNNGDIIYTKAQGHIGRMVGKVNGKSLNANCHISKGDAFKIFRNAIEVGSAIALESGYQVSLSINGDVDNDDDVAITSQVALIESTDNAKRTLPITISVTARVGQPMTITAHYLNLSTSCSSDTMCMLANNTADIQGKISQQLYKTGNSYFTITDIVFDIDNIFLQISSINLLRRQLLRQLQDTIVVSYNAQLDREQVVSHEMNCQHQPISSDKIMTVCYSTDSVVTASQDSRIDSIIYYTSSLSREDIAIVGSITNKKIYVDIPSFADLDSLDLLLGTSLGIVANNVGHLEWCIDNSVEYCGGSGLNLYNSISCNIISKGSYPYIFSQELTLREISNIASPLGYSFVDGRIVVMKTVHCPYKVNGYDCNNCYKAHLYYIDSKGNQFGIARRKFGRCTFDIVNGVKLSVGNNIVNSGNYLVDYCQDVVAKYHSINREEQLSHDTNNIKYTKGRLFDKVN